MTSQDIERAIPAIENSLTVDSTAVEAEAPKLRNSSSVHLDADVLEEPHSCR